MCKFQTSFDILIKFFFLTLLFTSQSAPRRRIIDRSEGAKGKAPVRRETVAGHDSETAPVVPRPTSGESSRKRPIEDEEDLLEDVRYQRVWLGKQPGKRTTSD